MNPIDAHFSVPSPVEEIRMSVLDEHRVRLLIKRDDLIHPQVSGNKWRKLKYNVERIVRDRHIPILTFGGAFSNHIRAVATIASLLGVSSTGVIRGEPGPRLNPVLAYARDNGMRLHFIDRQSWRRRNDPDFIAELKHELGGHHVLPEGGANVEGVRGCSEILGEVEEDFDTVFCALGTGTTLAGLVAAMPVSATAIGVPVVKGGEYLQADVKRLLSEAGFRDNGRWSLETGYHFGGFGRRPEELCRFTERLVQETGIPFEPIYTGKMMYALVDLVERGYFVPGSTLLAIHTGGVF